MTEEHHVVPLVQTMECSAVKHIKI